VLFDDFAKAEPDVWNVILARLLEDWYDKFSVLILANVLDNGGERVQARDSIVVSLLVNAIRLNDLRNKLLDDPVFFESLGQLLNFLDSHLSDRSCGIVQISHENAAEFGLVCFFAEQDTKSSNKVKNGHPDPPVVFFCHLRQLLRKSIFQHNFLTNNLGDLFKSSNDVELNLSVIILQKVHQHGNDLLDCVVLSDNLCQLAKRLGGTSSELSCVVRVMALKGWQEKVLDLLNRQTL